MTFIASVIAKNGVAIIADSLVTTKKRVMEESSYYAYLEKNKDPQNGNFIVDPIEISKLFKPTTSHTKDYEEKLFEFDKWTAITTAGSAYINGNKIQKVVENIIAKLKEDKNVFVSTKTIQEKIQAFISKLEIEVKEHIQNNEYITPTDFIFTHYDNKIEKTTINRVAIKYSDKDSLTKTDYEFISNIIAEEHEKVVFGGQDRITERILFGNFFPIANALPILLDCVIEELKIDRSSIPSNIVEKFMRDNDKIKAILYDGIKIAYLDELSLQEAVELANLLMRIEMDFQKYTETIPTVGGVIKIAIINKSGFRFLAGDRITPPLHI